MSDFWEPEGFRLGASLDFVHSLVVVGDDPVAAARVALGVARAQCGRRRVAIGDLLGEAAPLQALVEGDDPHGLTDSFAYGVSLNKIARPVSGESGLFILPTGSEQIDYGEILPSQRWRRLASGFREMDSLLILAVPSWADKVAELIAVTDGAIVVGESVPAGVPSSRFLARVRSPEHVQSSEFASASPPDLLPWYRRNAVGIVAGAAATVAILAIGVWLAARPFDRSFSRGPAVAADTAGSPRSVITAPPPPLPGDAAGGGDLRPANPGDSADAAAFSVELKRANTQAGAILLLDEGRGDLPAGTFSPELIGGGEWFTIVGGAYADSAAADSLLRHLRASGSLEASSGGISRRPFAFVLHGSVRPESATSLASAQRRRGIPAYALRQSDGTAVVYAGAFPSPEKAARFADILRAAGIAPTLVYRTGRIF
jgi:hypothetical protein